MPPPDNMLSPARRAYLFVLTFLLLFGPRLGGLMLFDTISLASLWLVLQFWLSGRYRLPWLPGSRVPIGILAALTAYSLLVALAVPGGEFFYPMKFARTLLNYLGVWLLCILFHRCYGPVFARAILHHIFWACALHGAIMLLQYVSPTANGIILAISGYDRIKLDRVTGFTVSYNTLNVVLGFGLLIAAVCPQAFSGRARKAMPVGVLLIFGGMTLAGRTALYGTLLCSVWALVVAAGGARLRRLGVLAVFLAGVIAAGMLWFRFGGESARRFETTTLPMLTGPFASYQELGYLDDARGGSTVEELREMYYLPDSPLTLIFGNSCSGRSDVYIASDVGYVLLLHGIGIMGLTGVLVFYGYVLRAGWRLRPLARPLARLALMLLALVLAVGLKEQTLLTRHAFAATAFMLGIGYLLHHDARRAAVTLPRSARSPAPWPPPAPS